MQDFPNQAETHTLRGATERPALLTIRDVVEKMESLASAQLDDYMPNGYMFEYGVEIRGLLHRFVTGEAAVDTETAGIYFRACARRN